MVICKVYNATSPDSFVLMSYASTTSYTKILPSGTEPLFMTFNISSTTGLTMCSGTRISHFILVWNSGVGLKIPLLNREHLNCARPGLRLQEA